MSEQPPEEGQEPEQTDQSDQSDQSKGSEGSGPSEGSKTELDSGEPGDIGDDELPEDLQPTEDNPLARHPGQTGQEDDEIGTDREGEAETAPLNEDESDYGSAGSDG